MKIIIDAFGGDNAPLAVLEGCEMAVKEYGVDIILTGNEAIIREVAKANGISLNKMEIANAESVMPIEEDPTEILKKYKDSSLAVGLKMVGNGNGDAFVSAGSTGALVVGASMIIKRLKGIKRAALGTLIPTLTNKGSYLLLDAGANQECRPEMLAQFAVMGSAYMDKIEGRKNPKVGLVNIGAEETKGLSLQIKAYEILKTAPVNFIGNVEGRGLPLCECDVAVCDGFTGNIVLKVTEGMGKSVSNILKEIFTKSLKTKIGAAMVIGEINDIKKKMDYSEAGGAPLLGLRKPVIKAHGSSNAIAFKNAIKQAKLFLENDVTSAMSEALTKLIIKEEDSTEE